MLARPKVTRGRRASRWLTGPGRSARLLLALQPSELSRRHFDWEEATVLRINSGAKAPEVTGAQVASS